MPSHPFPLLTRSCTSSPPPASPLNSSFQIAAAAAAADESDRSDSSSQSSRLVFVYGTLKRGFGNFWLMQELVNQQHARFVSAATTRYKFPLVCGPFHVPFLLNFPSRGHRVHGEVYLVDQIGLRRLDELEGVGRGYYERRSIVIDGLDQNQSLISSRGSSTAEAYFADPSYAFRMLEAPHLPSYGSVEAAGYIPRKNRPPGRTFLENVQAWIAAGYGRKDAVLLL